MQRKRVPGYITTESSNNFGLDVKVQRPPYPKADMPAAGDPTPEGQTGLDRNDRGGRNYREVIPPGTIGSKEDLDSDLLALPQYVDTVPSYPTEQNDTRLHGALAALRAADTQEIPFQRYPTFQPRSAPIPRAAQDEGFLEAPANLAADPLMTDEDSSKNICQRDARRKDLFGDNRDGVLHNESRVKA